MPVLNSVFRSARRVVFSVVVSVVAFVIIWAAVDIENLMQLSTGLLGIAAAVGGLAALTYTHAATLELPARRWINREASVLFQSTIYWVFSAGLAYICGLQARNQGFALDALIGVLLVGMSVFVLIAFIQAAAAINYVLDALADPEEIATLESKQKGPLARVLNRNPSTTNAQ